MVLIYSSSAAWSPLGDPTKVYTQWKHTNTQCVTQVHLKLYCLRCHHPTSFWFPSSSSLSPSSSHRSKDLHRHSHHILCTVFHCISTVVCIFIASGGLDGISSGQFLLLRVVVVDISRNLRVLIKHELKHNKDCIHTELFLCYMFLPFLI